MEEINNVHQKLLQNKNSIIFCERGFIIRLLMGQKVRKIPYTFLETYKDYFSSRTYFEITLNSDTVSSVQNEASTVFNLLENMFLLWSYFFIAVL